jgi:GH25 family lysozyme M1 (1,4-beta-N-acetylmuramidase)
LGARAKAARRSGADIFLSLHANGAGPGRRGAEVWLHPRASPRSRALAARLQEALARATPGGATVKTGELAVLDPRLLGGRADACLLELDYLSHPEGERRLADPAEVDGIARALADTLRLAPAFGHVGYAVPLTAGIAGAPTGIGSAMAASQATQIDGIDIYAGNSSLPAWIDLLNAGFLFVIHKTNEFGPGHPAQTDSAFLARWPVLQAEGFIRGTFDLVHHQVGTAEDQADTAASMVRRLVPGDLGPSLDMEDRTPAHSNQSDPGFWVDFAHRYLDRIESSLGRRPMIYSSRSYWQEFTGNSGEFVEYPLWVVDPNHAGTPDLPKTRAGNLIWPTWAFWQWHYEKSATAMPAPFTAPQKGVDLDRFNGTVYQLRGMADLGHTAPHVAGNTRFVAYTEVDGRVHVLTDLGYWLDADLFDYISGPPVAAGDPAALGLGEEQILVFRAVDNHVYAVTRSLDDASGGWSWRDITSATGSLEALDDPSIGAYGGDVHVAYRDANDHQAHLMRIGGNWYGEDMSTGAPLASGSASIYTFQGARHIVARAGSDGHLHDLYRTGAVSPPADDDLTATAQDSDGDPPPAATYRPAVYLLDDPSPRIVFRAIRGEIWQIERDTLRAANLGAAAGGAPNAAGSLSAVAAGQAHVLYRSVEGAVIDLWNDGGGWHFRDIGCGLPAAADPTAYLDGGSPAVGFQAAGGTIHLARLVDGAWNCERIVPQKNPPPPA